MSRSVQTMMRMPLASVVACTCSMPGTRVAGAGAPGLAGLAAAEAVTAAHERISAPSARDARVFCMRELYTHKRKAPHAGEVASGAKKRTPGKSCSQSFVRTPLSEELPRSSGGVDRRELCSRQSRVDGRETHAATTTSLDQHSRQLGPLARDALRVGKYQRHC